MLYQIGRYEQAGVLMKQYLIDHHDTRRKNKLMIARDIVHKLLPPMESVTDSISGNEKGEELLILADYSYAELQDRFSDDILRQTIAIAIETNAYYTNNIIEWIRSGLEPDDRIRELAKNSMTLKKASQRVRSKLLKALGML